MLQLSHRLDGTENWDTNWARKHLKIPLEQLKKLENIPEWRTHQILTTDNTANRRIHIVNTEKDSLLQSNLIFEKFSQSNSASKNIENSKVSVLQSTRNKPINVTFTENKLTRSASLNFLNLCDKFLNHQNLRSSNSAPNITELVLSNSDLSSIEHHTACTTDSQKFEASKLSKFNPSEGKLNDTFIVTKLDKMESFSQPEMNYNRFPQLSIPLPIEKLTDKILNHKYLKGSVNSTRKSEDTEFVKVSIQEGSKQNILDLPSFCKESVSSKGNLALDDNLGIAKNQELLKPIDLEAPKDTELQVQSIVPNAGFDPSDMLNEDCVQECASGVPNLVEESRVIVNQDKEKNTLKYECIPFATPRETAKNEESTALGVNDETFGSQLIPCGQPMPVEVDPCSLPNITKESNIELPDKSAVILTNKVASTGNSGGNDIAQNLPHVGVRSSGTKRKRKSKVETPKKIREAKHSIHFTEDQVRNMLEMIKMLHSET